jgi:hypothetical protein
MPGAQAMTSGFGMVVTALRVAAAALFAAFNLLPLYGIYAWGWDAFQLLLLYWGETVVLFACTLGHIALRRADRTGQERRADVGGLQTVHAQPRLALSVGQARAGSQNLDRSGHRLDLPRHPRRLRLRMFEFLKNVAQRVSCSIQHLSGA